MLRSGGRLHPRRERLGALAGAVPVPGTLDRGEGSTGDGQVGILADGVGEGGVEAHPLTRQSILVHGLGGERVPEHVAAALAVWLEDVAIEQLP